MSQCVVHLLHCIVSFVLINHPTLSEIDSASATDWEDENDSRNADTMAKSLILCGPNLNPNSK